MNELIQQVQQRVGLNEDQARRAVDVVLGFIKQRLPGPLAGQLDNYLKGGGESGGGLGSLGGLFDKSA